VARHPTFSVVNFLFRSARMASGRFLYPANDVLGDAQPQKFYTLADSVHVAWESYVTNTLDRRLYLAYYLLDLSKPWQYGKYWIDSTNNPFFFILQS